MHGCNILFGVVYWKIQNLETFTYGSTRFLTRTNQISNSSRQGWGTSGSGTSIIDFRVDNDRRWWRGWWRYLRRRLRRAGYWSRLIWCLLRGACWWYPSRWWSISCRLLASTVPGLWWWKENQCVQVQVHVVCCCCFGGGKSYAGPPSSTPVVVVVVGGR